MQIPMVDLKSQYLRIKPEIDEAILNCVESAKYIKGPEVKTFEEQLSHYLQVEHVISCGNGTDALQIAFMALGLQPGNEIIVPAFTYVATAEAIVLLNLKPVMVDVEWDSFNILIEEIEKNITAKTRAIVPVHLYGQSCNMDAIMQIAKKHNLYVIEDNAQALGSKAMFNNDSFKKTGTIGDIGCNSFFPTKNLGCFGDGGAITTNNSQLAEKCRMIAVHGQKQKYRHEIVGCNSRLDSMQAAVLNVKLKYLDEYIVSRQNAGRYYLQNIKESECIKLPSISPNAVHTFNQFTLKVKDEKRNALQLYLKEKGIPSAIYYPLPLHKQPAFKKYVPNNFTLKNAEKLCDSVLSIPIHTELNQETQDKIIEIINNFS